MFYLDLNEQCLLNDSRKIELTPKRFSVLCYLVQHPNSLVTKQELLDNIWPHSYVTEGLIKGYVRSLRKLLDDDPNNPRFIETVHGRGYRFIGSVAVAATDGRGQGPAPLGQEAALERLRERLEQALKGQRQLVFIGGKTGSGKTALMKAFFQRLRNPPNKLMSAKGRCFEHFGAVEPQMPILEALDQLCQGADASYISACLRRYSPSCLMRLPWLMDSAEWTAIGRPSSAEQVCLVRQLAHAFEAMAAERGLLLWLEDLQWSDHATLDLIAHLAQRRLPTRLMLVATYRPADTRRDAPLAQRLCTGLRARELCDEWRLAPSVPGAH